MEKETLQENQYHFPYHHLTHEQDGVIYIFRRIFWGLEHYTYIQFVINEVLKYTSGSIADVGCGEGRIMTELTNKLTGRKIYGYDISQKAIDHAKAFASRPEFSVHDITRAQLPAKVSAIISCEVIEHIKPEEVDSYCKNIADSLETGGILFLTTPTTNIPTSKKHYQHFTLQTLETHLLPYFKIEEVKYLNKVNWYSKFLNRLISNKYYLSSWTILNRFVSNEYKRRILNGSEKRVVEFTYEHLKLNRPLKACCKLHFI